MLKRILCVDDEPKILQAFERQLRTEFDIVTAVGPERGLESLAQGGPFAAVVSDLRMPEMDGIEFLSRVKRFAPDTVRIMLTGQAELATAIAAVNRGSVFQFLTKPCPTEVLIHALEAAVEQYRLITSERELIEQTLRRTIVVLTEVLSLANPLAFSRAQHIRHYVRHMAARLDLPEQWQYELAALLSQIGFVAVPPQVLEKLRAGEALDPGETSIVGSQSKIGYDLLAQIPRLEIISHMVARQNQEWESGRKDVDRVSVGAQLLKIAQNFHDAIVRGGEVGPVVNQMLKSAAYNPDFVVLLDNVYVACDTHETRVLHVDQLRIRMVIDADVFSKGGLLLLAKGQEITPSAILRLHNFASTIGVVEPIKVIVPYADPPSFGDKADIPAAADIARLHTPIPG
ncbi:MAG TPA: HD domain-containing phosphohydrolase [Bryobacteraceae bacterium]|jgi:response regulator RpfG family c-di-GMP phosphodiesterase